MLVVPLSLAVGCKKKDSTLGGIVTTTSHQTTSTGGGGSGGGGTGGSATGGGGSGGEVVAPPADVACAGDYAFRANGMSFGLPTPAALGTAFNELGYDSATQHPITVVLAHVNASEAALSLGPSVDDGNGQQIFVAGLEPSAPTSAALKQGSFASLTPAADAFLMLRHTNGHLDLALASVNIVASTSGQCSQAFVTLDATIPASERSKSLTIASGSTTVGALAGGNAGDDIQLHALFVAANVAFDFSTL